MRSRRRRPRGPRPNPQGAQPGAGPVMNSQAAPYPSGGQQGQGQGQGAGQRPARRRRRRGGNRPVTNTSASGYTNQGPPQFEGTNGPRGGAPQQRRRRGRSGGRQNGERRRGLEVLREMQQAGVALDPTERLILE